MNFQNLQMKKIITIEGVMDEILKEEIHFLDLKDKLNEYSKELIQLSGLVLENEQNKKDIHHENGMALSTTFAARCIDDIIRTRQFIRGIYQAIEDLQLKKSKPITLFYAGTGPFATLSLPILTKFSPQELQLILLYAIE